MERVVFLGLVLLIVVLIYNSFKTQKKYRKKTKLIQQEIETLKKRNILLDEKKSYNVFQLSDLSNIFNQVLDLHKMVVKKYLK
jgi:4-hydroxyphenylpyruvate dioxygenase-like putative hemolysin